MAAAWSAPSSSTPNSPTIAGLPTQRAGPGMLISRPRNAGYSSSICRPEKPIVLASKSTSIPATPSILDSGGQNRFDGTRRRSHLLSRASAAFGKEPPTQIGSDHAGGADEGAFATARGLQPLGKQQILRGGVRTQRI